MLGFQVQATSISYRTDFVFNEIPYSDSIISRDVPDTLFYRIPDTGYTRISNSTRFWIILNNRFYRIPDYAGIMLGKVCQVSFKLLTH